MTFPFTKDRFVHVLLERAGAVCLVERTNAVTGSVHWEVVVLRPQPARRLPSGAQAPTERYPKGNDWGTYGWTYTDITNARQKWAQVVAAQAQKGGSHAA